MKSAGLKTMIVAGCLLLLVSAAGAMETRSLDNASFSVTLYCTDDFGGYCSKGEIKKDRFTFTENAFDIESFSTQFLGFLDSGSYSASGMVFSADFLAIKDLTSKYEFDVQGISLLSRVLVGSIRAAYSGWVLAFPPRFEKLDEATLYFFGFRD
jgi:hypothetical protein